MAKRRRTLTAFCKVCHNEFTASAYGAMYCSNACKQTAYRARSSNKTERKASTKVQPGERAAVRKYCPHCGTRFVQGRKDQKFCGASCRVVANRNKQYRTIGKMMREANMSAYDVMQIAGSKHGWKALYAKLETWGFTWSDTKELWLGKSEAELAKLI